MYPYISRVLAEEHARDLRNEARWAHRVRQARLVQRARRVTGFRKVQVPDSFEDFLCQTAESVMREPTAGARASGQAIQ